MKAYISKLPQILVLLSFGMVLSSCATEDRVFKMIDKYFEDKGVEAVEKTLDKIIQKRQKAAQPTLEDRMKNRVETSIVGAPVKGLENAPITIVEFSDFECPFCSRVLPAVDQVMKTYEGKVKLAFRQNPLPFHKSATPAAKAAMAAQEQGKFWEYHDLLFKNQRELNEKNFIKWAKDLKLDVAKFEKDMKNPAYQKRIDEDQDFARKNGAGGTPSFFINGVRLVGAQPFENFKEIIDGLLKEKS
ncbi:MAG: hypothetical protein COV44_06265 [Deltaproteobacteria bacterium CG11_big_fil_rev_8_21_14_0_20_45_16]|nr:MAG: hypothetical protein COV44_06265 [Deltaproteobacteria bacterium CG11_big_fil_rev_8_21_14_0_20_45_16]